MKEIYSFVKPFINGSLTSILTFMPVVVFELTKYGELSAFDDDLVNAILSTKGIAPNPNSFNEFEYALKNYHSIMQHVKAFGNNVFLGGLSGVFSACVYSTNSHKKFVHSFNNENINSFDDYSILLLGGVFGATASLLKPFHPTYKVSHLMNFVDSPVFGAIVGVFAAMVSTNFLTDDEISTIQEVFGVDENIPKQDF